MTPIQAIETTDLIPISIEELSSINHFQLDTQIKQARFFVIKSLCEDDIHKAIKYKIWTSSKEGNFKLNDAFHQANGAYPIYLFFSVIKSGFFVGVARMSSEVDFNKKFMGWIPEHQWPGQFCLEWLYVKDIPNNRLKNIRLP